MTRPNGVTTNYTYNNLSQLLSVLHQVGDGDRNLRKMVRGRRRFPHPREMSRRVGEYVPSKVKGNLAKMS